MVLLKYFAKELQQDWIREVEMGEGLSYSDDPHDNLLHFRWHSKGEWPIYFTVCLIPSIIDKKYDDAKYHKFII